jgi:sugar diacid utilization regulator
MAVEVDTIGGALRRQLAAMRGLFVLTNLMLTADGQDEILQLAVGSLPSLGAYLLLGVYLAAPGTGEAPHHVSWWGPPSVISELDMLAGADATLEVAAGSQWIWASSMRSTSGHQGYLVVSAETEPSPSERFLLSMLAEQTATALTTAQEIATLLATSEARAQLNARLEASVTEWSRRARAYELMTEAAIGGNVSDLAKATSSLTHLPVAIVDQFGYLLADAEAGTVRDVWAHVRLPSHRNLIAAAHAGKPVRQAKLLLAAAKPGSNVLGAVVLLDAAHTAGEFESYVLERAAALLTGELAHQRALVEMELRLRRELVVELVEGLDDDEACTRAALVGHDLHQPHQVAAIRCDGDLDRSWIEIALRQAGSPDGSSPLVGRSGGLLLAILQSGAQAQRLHEGLKQIRADVSSSIGLGSEAHGPSELPRSYAEALRALRVRERSPEPDGGSNFSELGLYQVLEDRERGGALDTFIRHWLGALLDYDRARHAEMVNTLARFLDCGGNYDLAAQSLLIHRSTLRYRLRRIRDLGDMDLSDVETRLNLHVATRAWRVFGTD